MKEKILTIDIDNPLFELIIEDCHEEIEVVPRRGSNYFCKKIFLVDEKTLPENSELYGYWRTDRVIDDHEWGMEDGEIHKLFRVEKKEKQITTIYYTDAE